VILADGAFVAAREVVPGAMLGEYTVTAVSRAYDGVVNPITVAGTILAAAAEGKPVLASVYPEWIASHMLSSCMPLPLSLSNLLALAFPATAQAFYDALIEPLFPTSGASYRAHLEAVPSALVPATIVVGDLAVAAAFGLYATGPLLAASAAAAGVASVLARK